MRRSQSGTPGLAGVAGRSPQIRGKKKKGTGATSPQVGWVLRCATVGGARLPATGAQNSGLEESTRELVKASRTGKMQRTTEALAKENKIMRAEMSARSRKDKWRSIALCCCVVWVAR